MSSSPRSPAPPWLPFVLIPLATLLLRVAYYAHRSVFALKVSELGFTPAQIGTALASGEALAMAGYALGAVLVSVRPHAAALVGALLCLLGLGLFQLNPGAWTTAEMAIRLGMGCFQLGVLVVLVVSSLGFQRRMLAVAALLGAGTLGGLVGPLLGGAAYAGAQRSGALLPALLALVGVAVSGHLTALPRGNKQAAARRDNCGLRQRWLLSLGLCLLGGLGSALYSASTNAPYQAEPSFWFNLRTSFGPPLLGALGVVLAGALAPERSWSRARSFGVGLILFSAAALVSAHATQHGLNANLLAGLALAGFAQPIVESLLLAALFGVWPKRRAGLAYLGFALLTSFAQARAWLAFAAQPTATASLVWWGTALGALGLLLGVAALVFSRRVEALLSATEVDPDFEPAVASIAAD